MRRIFGLVCLLLIPAVHAAGTSTPVARVGDTTITLEQVDALAMQAGIAPFQALYEARARALEQLIAQELVQREAAARGVSVEELFQTEVTARLGAVSDEQVRGFYEENRAGMGDRALEQVSEQIRQYLQNQNGQQLQQAFLDGLRQRYPVTVDLSPPRVEVNVAENDPTLGPDDAPVTLVTFSDFQ